MITPNVLQRYQDFAECYRRTEQPFLADMSFLPSDKL